MKTLAAFYDLSLGPISYDFVTWLARAMRERDARGCERLHVVLVPCENGLGGFSRNWGNHDEAAARWRLWNICVASCPLARASVTLCDSRAQANRIRTVSPDHWWPEGKAHFMGPLVLASRNGAEIPLLAATDAARNYVAQFRAQRMGGAPYVTLTLRRQSTDPDRNTTVASWQAFAEWLRNERKMNAVVVNETNDALAAGLGYAELSPDLRLALYEGAAMNVIGNNGPQELLKFSAAPYMIVGLALTAGWRDHFRRYFHMEPGDQLPWARARQRMIYRPDDVAVLRAEFDAVMDDGGSRPQAQNA